MTVIKRIDHVSIAVHDMEPAARFLVDVLGAIPNTPRRLSHHGNFYWADWILAGFKIELVQPADPENGDIARYLKKHGQGFHHMTFEVEDINAAIDHFEGKGSRVVQKNLDTDDGWREAFLSPRTSFGCLFQLFDEVRKTDTAE